MARLLKFGAPVSLLRSVSMRMDTRVLRFWKSASGSGATDGTKLLEALEKGNKAFDKMNEVSDRYIEDVFRDSNHSKKDKKSNAIITRTLRKNAIKTKAIMKVSSTPLMRFSIGPIF